MVVNVRMVSLPRSPPLDAIGQLKLPRETSGVSGRPSNQHLAKQTHESVEGLAGTLERVDDVERGDRLPLGVLSVCRLKRGVSSPVPPLAQNGNAQVTESRMTFSRKILRTPRVSS